MTSLNFKHIDRTMYLMNVKWSHEVDRRSGF